MASPPVEGLDFDKILAPISEENPTGEELSRSAPSLDRVITLRNESKDSEKRLRDRELYGEEEDAPPINDPKWRELITAAAELLGNESKDLRVAAWLAEGLMREHGFGGLRDGLRVCAGLCTEQFWPNIYPRPDEFDGHEMTVAQLSGLTGDGALIPLAEIALTNAGDDKFNLNHYADASALDSLDPGTREKRVQEGAVSFDTFENAVRNSPSEFYRNLVDDLTESIELLNTISNFLDDNCLKNQYDKETSPSVIPMRNKLDEIKEMISGLARHHLVVEEEEGEGEEVSVDGTVITTTQSQKAASMADGTVTTRDDAFRALSKIADFFERTEPHSPISHAVRQAVSWGSMTYSQLQEELIQDQNVRQALFLRVGVPKSEGE